MAGQTHIKPDAMYVSETLGMALVLDMTVPFDQNLATAYDEKIERYEWMLEPLRRSLNVPRALVVPITIGALGGVPQWVIDTFRGLSFPYDEVYDAVTAASAAAVTATCTMVKSRDAVVAARLSQV